MLSSIFQKNCAEIKTQFCKAICVLCSNNARVYLSSQFQDFLAKQEILHQTTFLHTPQQNGVTQCKIRHLIEIVKTLLIHMNVPLRFWVDVVCTTCY